jgi:hypothetical protein
MTSARRFSGPALTELAKAEILGVRAGTEHRHTGVWVVVVEGRIFVRSWNDQPTGWYRACQAQPLGSIQFVGREIAVRARRLRGEREAVAGATSVKLGSPCARNPPDRGVRVLPGQRTDVCFRRKRHATG